jgi:Glycosyl hydrolase family 3 N terminal domain
VPRLGIQGSGHIEGLHGVAYGGPGGWEGHGLKPLPTTQFPQSVGLGETWDPDLLKQAAAIEAYEARYIFQSENLYSTGRRGEHWRREGIVIRAPNVDLGRDPPWGRSEESYGEDPYLTGTMAVAFVRGLQGDDPHYWRTASLMKHFLANTTKTAATDLLPISTSVCCANTIRCRSVWASLAPVSILAKIPVSSGERRVYASASARSGSGDAPVSFQSVLSVDPSSDSCRKCSCPIRHRSGEVRPHRKNQERLIRIVTKLGLLKATACEL